MVREVQSEKKMEKEIFFIKSENRSCFRLTMVKFISSVQLNLPIGPRKMFRTNVIRKLSLCHQIEPLIADLFSSRSLFLLNAFVLRLDVVRSTSFRWLQHSPSLLVTVVQDLVYFRRVVVTKTRQSRFTKKKNTVCKRNKPRLLILICLVQPSGLYAYRKQHSFHIVFDKLVKSFGVHRELGEAEDHVQHS